MSQPRKLYCFRNNVRQPLPHYHWPYCSYLRSWMFPRLRRNLHIWRVLGPQKVHPHRRDNHDHWRCVTSKQLRTAADGGSKSCERGWYGLDQQYRASLPGGVQSKSYKGTLFVFPFLISVPAFQLANEHKQTSACNSALST
jgi:hypothetical protein